MLEVLLVQAVHGYGKGWKSCSRGKGELGIGWRSQRGEEEEEEEAT